ncbi:CorA metal ion transporter [Recurvomyces mirabilis]|uniref:CorA metal ion transporter n=1 Tax=Recurvomyces mirabilis TaxID=574656 RepID=A0AAE0TPA8_9PEZI|nr:CorA metal ion transporter [Recurvomyces mirabilis]KAK5152350.1 CorA metal ion transporter [Recurvomyces mirabilis]
MASNGQDLSKVSGPESMSKPTTSSIGAQVQNGAPSMDATADAVKPKKKKRGGKNKRKTRKQSFAAATESGAEGMEEERPSLLDVPDPHTSAQQHNFYRLRAGKGSNTSLESEALLDHREHESSRSRRESLSHGFSRPSLPMARNRGSGYSAQYTAGKKSRLARGANSAIEEDDDEEEDATDQTALLASSARRPKPQYSRTNSSFRLESPRARRSSGHSKGSQKKKIGVDISARPRPGAAQDENDSDYDVNNPPSVPNSPKIGSMDDIMMGSHDSQRGRDAVISIDGDYRPDRMDSEESPDASRRRPTIADLAERDVCFPGEDTSELGEDDRRSTDVASRTRRKHAREFPNYGMLEDWAMQEKEERTHQEQIRVKKISEPIMVGGRLRPGKSVWHREEDDAPFRFTYFNELMDSTIHARTISDLQQEGLSFRDLFTPEPIELSSSESEDDEEGDDNGLARPSVQHTLQRHLSQHPPDSLHTGQDSNGGKRSPSASVAGTGSNTPRARDESGTPRPRLNGKRFSAKPTFWLDVLQPTEEEMKVIARSFGIHQLTVEDIMMQEQREKVELFSKYYFVNYRSFEQDQESEDYLEPVNMYIVVFREGVLTFHHSMTPHPANVRRRIRQLNDYMSPSADWISYGIIDDVTDAYLPLVQSIEEEVDEIDDQILGMHENSGDIQKQQAKASKQLGKALNEKEGSPKPTNQADMGAQKAEGEKTIGESGGDMLRRVGECRKRVMSLYRLLGNKADVIKGFAKRCNEHWQVAPRSEIGLYLGDIQDHIVTMTGNLSHYENLLSRAHSNYLAQINLRMNERSEQTADVLGKLTVLGTIVLPMNIVTGLWGMNVWVPGQEYEGNLIWFWWVHPLSYRLSLTLTS